MILVKGLQHHELRAALRQQLIDVDPLAIGLTCADNQGKPVACPGGFCQLAASGTTQVDRKCVPAGSVKNPYGLLIGSGFAEQPNANVYSYTCNRDLCNDGETWKQVQKILRDYGFLSFDEPLVTEAATTTRSGEPSTIRNSAIRFVIDACLLIPWTLLRYFV